mgnify:FL=1
MIDPTRRLVTSRGTGTFCYRDHLDHVETIGRDPRFQPEFNHLVDCRGFDHFDLTSAEIQAMSRLTIFAASSRRALVVASLLHFGLARIFAALRSRSHRQETAVFRTLDDAVKWLGLPATYNPGSHAEAMPTTQEA